MRVVTTKQGVETTLNKTDLKTIANVLEWLDPLVMARPLVPSYTMARDALREIQRMFDTNVRILEEFRVTIEGIIHDREDDAAGSDTATSESDNGDRDTEPTDSPAKQLVTEPYGTAVSFDGSDGSPYFTRSDRTRPPH